MTTLLSARQQMLAIDQSLGRVETIASLAAQTITVTALASGTVGAKKFTSKWALRPQAADAANRAPRLISDYTSSTGVLTHAGAAYTDTTATGETVEIHEYEPWRLEAAIQQALATLRRIDTDHLQGRSDGRYTFENQTWISQPNDVVRLGPRPSPVLTGNRDFHRWGVVHTDGTLRPDRWTLGASGTYVRSSTARRGYSLSVTRAGTDSTVDQTFAVDTAAGGSGSLRGQTVTGVLVAQTTVASSGFVRVTSEKADGTVISTTNSAYHTGGGAWEELTAVHTVDSAADLVRVQGRVAVNGAVLMDDLYGCIGSVDDAVRRDHYRPDWMTGEWEQNPLAWWGPMDPHGQIAVVSRRPYPQFDATRIKAGTADTDTTDCDQMLLAYKALAILFDSLSKGPGGNGAQAVKAAEYGQQAADLAAAHLADVQDDQPGARLYTGASYGVMRRMR